MPKKGSGYVCNECTPRVDDVAMWNRALTEDEIQTLYENGMTVTRGGKVGWTRASVRSAGSPRDA